MKKYKSFIPEITLKHTKSNILKAKIHSSENAYEYFKQFYKDDINIYESAFLILLNFSNNTIGWVKISQGGIKGTVIDEKLVAKYCIESLASGCIICHNHPSGNLLPSKQDINIKDLIKKGLNYFNITLLDFIIITEDNYYSFIDEGIL